MSLVWQVFAHKPKLLNKVTFPLLLSEDLIRFIFLALWISKPNFMAVMAYDPSVMKGQLGQLTDRHGNL